MRRRFTGRDMLFVLLGGFGIVIAVNLTMAVFAARHFPGFVVENSYVASQEFNKGLEAGRQQQLLGWQVDIGTDGDLLVAAVRNAAGEPLRGAHVEAVITHPVAASEPVHLTLAEQGDGRWQAAHRLPRGQWEVELTVRRDGKDHWSRDRITVE